MRARVRLSVRSLMVLIALSAIAAVPAARYMRMLRKRSQEYADAAKAHRWSAAEDLNAARLGATIFDAETIQGLKRRAKWDTARAAVYDQGSRRPWFAISYENPPHVEMKPAPTRLPDIDGLRKQVDAAFPPRFGVTP